ncbi:response regulator [Echinimonas agarilytica]|uniref:Response regulator n=1 Tax=Echinimonas agarilytica TaxID=1215918 RepID=A0AA41W901_9GAMM|nr:response regulator [Echinimonas agarilytica]MCM2681270.1 response regulator [Echinimonas agarilytica]
MTYQKFDNEHLQERLLDLLRSNEQVQQREMDATALLDIIQVIGEANSGLQVIDSLLQGVQVITGHHSSLVLEPQPDHQGYWLEKNCTHPSFKKSLWCAASVFERVLAGEVVVLFKPSLVDEFQDQDPALLENTRSALILSVISDFEPQIIILFHRNSNHFSPHQKEAIRRLKPMVEQRLQSLEFDAKLRKMVAKRTNDLRQSQKRMASFARSSSDWFWEMDDQMRFCYTSTQDHQDAITMRDDLFGKTILELRTGQECTKLNKWFSVTRILQDRGAIRDFEFELDLPSRTPIWIRISGEPFFSERGVFEGYRGTAKNITERKSEERELSAQIQQFSNRNQSLQRPELLVAEPSPNQPETNEFRVLLVDDCESSQMITQLMLMNLGYPTETVESGAKALKLSSLKDFELILMDLDMPDMSGEEVSRQMRMLGVSAPILALTGCSYAQRGEQVADAGMNGFIEKPVRLNVLQEQLNKTFAL